MTTQDTSFFFGQGKQSDTMPMDRWDRYLLPDADGTTRGWTRATTFADSLANPYALNQWQQRQVALGLGRRPDLLALASTISGPEDKQALKEIVEQAHEAAGTHAQANLGTAVHRARQNLIKYGTTPPAELAGDVDAMNSIVAKYGYQPVPELVERVCVIPEYHVAGRWDEVWRCPDGKLRIGDTKTGKVEPYNHLKFCVQVAVYAHASAMWNEETKQYEPMPPIERDYAMILHNRPGSRSPELLRVNISLGWALARLCQEARDARKLDGLITPMPAPPNSHLFESGVPTQVVGGYTVPTLPTADPGVEQPGATQRAADADQLQIEAGLSETEAWWQTHPDDDGSDDEGASLEQAGTPGDARPPSQVLKDATPRGEVRESADGTLRMWDGVKDWHVVHGAQRVGPAAKTIVDTKGLEYHFGDLASQCPICSPLAGNVEVRDPRVEQAAAVMGTTAEHAAAVADQINAAQTTESSPVADAINDRTGGKLDEMIESLVKVAKTKARVQDVARKALEAMGLPESTLKLNQQQRKIARQLIELAVERGHDLSAQLPGCFVHALGPQSTTLADKAKASDDELRAQVGEQPSGMPPAPATEPAATMHADNYAASVIGRIKIAQSVAELQQLRDGVGAAWTDAMTDAARVKADEINAATGAQPLSPMQQIEGATSNETIQRVWRSVTDGGSNVQAWTEELQAAATRRMATISKGS